MQIFFLIFFQMSIYKYKLSSVYVKNFVIYLVLLCYSVHNSQLRLA